MCSPFRLGMTTFTGSDVYSPGAGAVAWSRSGLTMDSTRFSVRLPKWMPWYLVVDVGSRNMPAPSVDEIAHVHVCFVMNMLAPS